MNDLSLLTSNGFACVKKAFSSEELENANGQTQALIQGWEQGEEARADFWTWQPSDQARPILYRIHNLERHSIAVAKMTEAGPLPQLAEHLLGGPCRVTACALTIKLKGCGLAVPWHRDPISTPPLTIFNFSVYLDRSDATNGALAAIPGSHIRQDLDWTGEEAPPSALRLDAEPGDIWIHDVRLLHGSPACRGNRQRRAIVVEYQRIGEAVA